MTKLYGAHPVLQDFSFSIEEGERVALLGPSGSGKSTILRIMVALEGIDSGRVTIGGDVLSHIEQRKQLGSRSEQARARSGVGMVFQSYNLFPHMTALANVAAAPRQVLGVPKDEARARAETLLAGVGLRDHLTKYPAQLSGGQQQRVAIARAMAMQPRILLFDEITSSLDPELVGEVLDVIKNVVRERTVTVVFVTHHVGVARAIADRVCFFERGAIVEEGSPDQLINSPQNPRTRQFLQRVGIEVHA